MSRPIELGVEAPDFELKDQDNSLVTLSSLRGKNVLLSFHPLAWTNICHAQMYGLDTHMTLFDKLNTVPLGISVDSPPSQAAWAHEMNIERLRMLADFWPHGEVSRKFGIFREAEGFSERANIVVNERGTVIFARIYPLEEKPDITEIASLLKDYMKSDIDMHTEMRQCLENAHGERLCLEDWTMSSMEVTRVQEGL